ncbi:hypothetical protein JTE90_025472 [Oedothorax gibbosus]|uniref:NADP-dependent oxidoreductase domain-containing protein n=1 Tax=Oedothorax gibbosus TaxID=931172 RepID=A0AAV6UZ58_9ARAC|nr:hypothetical protein JTE90_025472 [Oedothorax gibbosus]
MSIESDYNKGTTLKNSLAPIASLECIDESSATSDGSRTLPPSRQISLSPATGIRYKNLGKSGLKISSVGLGTWVTFGQNIPEDQAEEIVQAAYDLGINIFDTADAYGGGRSEILLGKILKNSGWKRSSYIVATKLVWGVKLDSDRGLSRKFILEAIDASLERLQMDYVDIVYINRTDPMCPIEEVVRACTHAINQGKAMYWGTSRWTSMEIMEAYTVARQCHMIPPSAEQTEYHMFQREKVEIHLPELFHKIGTGTITWSPQAFGLLTGKFDEGVQLLSRGSLKSLSALQDRLQVDDGRNPKDQLKMRELNHLADKLGCSITQLTIAWCLKSEQVQCVLLGALSVDHLYDQLQALQIIPKLTSNISIELEKILDNKPTRHPQQR